MEVSVWSCTREGEEGGQREECKVDGGQGEMGRGGQAGAKRWDKVVATAVAWTARTIRSSVSSNQKQAASSATLVGLPTTTPQCAGHRVTRATTNRGSVPSADTDVARLSHKCIERCNRLLTLPGGSAEEGGRGTHDGW